MSNAKTKAIPPAKKRGPNDLEVTAQSGEDEAMTKARNVIAPTVRGAVTTQAFSGVSAHVKIVVASLTQPTAE